MRPETYVGKIVFDTTEYEITSDSINKAAVAETDFTTLQIHTVCPYCLTKNTVQCSRDFISNSIGYNCTSCERETEIVQFRNEYATTVKEIVTGFKDHLAEIETFSKGYNYKVTTNTDTIDQIFAKKQLLDVYTRKISGVFVFMMFITLGSMLIISPDISERFLLSSGIFALLALIVSTANSIMSKYLFYQDPILKDIENINMFKNGFEHAED